MQLPAGLGCVPAVSQHPWAGLQLWSRWPSPRADVRNSQPPRDGAVTGILSPPAQLYEVSADTNFAKPSDAACDVACFIYDPSNPRSFSYCATIYKVAGEGPPGLQPRSPRGWWLAAPLPCLRSNTTWTARSLVSSWPPRRTCQKRVSSPGSPRLSSATSTASRHPSSSPATARARLALPSTPSWPPLPPSRRYPACREGSGPGGELGEQGFVQTLLLLWCFWFGSSPALGIICLYK